MAHKFKGNVRVEGSVILPNETNQRVVETNAQGELQSSSVTSTELSHLSGVTSNLQTQLNGKSATGHTHVAADITDFDTEVSNNSDVSANTSARHDAVTVVDSAEIDFTLTGQQITASIVAGSIDESKLDTSVNASLDLADSASQPGHTHVAADITDFNSAVTGNSEVLANSAARHNAVTLNADDATQQTLNLSGQEIQVNLATTSSDGAMSLEDKTKLDGIEANATADQTATEVPFSATGNISATNVQTAIAELDAEKLALAGGTMSGNIAMGTNSITGLADPSAAQDAATKAYVDAVAEGLRPKEAVRVATTVAGTLASSFESGDTVDGITLVTGNRILIKNQADASENGIYVVEATGAPTRAEDFDSLTPIDEINGAYVAVQEGSANAGKLFVQQGIVTTIDTDDIDFVFFNSTSGLVGGDMITVSGSNISVDLATTSGLESSNPGNDAGQLRVKLEASNPSMQINGSNELGAKLNASGALVSEASGLTVQVDNSTIEISSNDLRVKALGIDNFHLSNSANIDFSKMEALTGNRSVITDGSGVITQSITTATELSYLSGATGDIQDQIDSKQLDVITTQGDLVIGDVLGGPSRLAIGSVGQVLRSNGTIASWETLAAGSDELIKVSANDTTAKYLEDALVASTGSNASFPLQITTLNDGGNEDLQVQFDETKVVHDNLSGFVANEHIDHSTVQIATAADSGLAGGGNITATRNLSVDINNTTVLSQAADDADKLLIWDASASALRSITKANLVGNADSSAGDISETSFSMANNQASAANVTGLAFANATVRSFKAQVSIEIDATANLFETYDLIGVQKDSQWDMAQVSAGDDSLVLFTITNAGQIQYTSASYAGFVSGAIKFRATTTSV